MIPDESATPEQINSPDSSRSVSMLHVDEHKDGGSFDVIQSSLSPGLSLADFESGNDGTSRRSSDETQDNSAQEVSDVQSVFQPDSDNDESDDFEHGDITEKVSNWFSPMPQAHAVISRTMLPCCNSRPRRWKRDIWSPDFQRILNISATHMLTECLSFGCSNFSSRSNLI